MKRKNNLLIFVISLSVAIFFISLNNINSVAKANSKNISFNIINVSNKYIIGKSNGSSIFNKSYRNIIYNKKGYFIIKPKAKIQYGKLQHFVITKNHKHKSLYCRLYSTYKVNISSRKLALKYFNSKKIFNNKNKNIVYGISNFSKRYNGFLVSSTNIDEQLKGHTGISYVYILYRNGIIVNI